MLMDACQAQSGLELSTFWSKRSEAHRCSSPPVKNLDSASLTSFLNSSLA